MTTDTFDFSRRFPLPPARMWTLLVDPVMRAQWAAPDEGSVMETLVSDLREGGVERQRCGPADNPDFETETRWYRLAEPELAVCTEVIEAGGERLGASLVTYTLKADGNGSAVGIVVAVTSFVGPEMIEEFRNGWSSGIAKLDAMARDAA